MTAFTSFAFPATGEPTARTMPARLAEIKNVKDYGAVGDGVADDTAAIQAAIDWQTSNGIRGHIFFPPGTYLLGSSVTFNFVGEHSIKISGCGSASVLTGNFADYLLKRDLGGSGSPTGDVCEITNLKFSNSHAAGGCLRWGSTVGLAVRQCYFNGYRCLNLTDSNGNVDQSHVVDSCVFSSGSLANAIAIIDGANGVISGCDITGFFVGIRMYGIGQSVIGCRMEVNGTAIQLGVKADTNAGTVDVCQGFSILNGSFESNGTAIDFVGGSGMGLIAGFLAHGFQGAAGYPLAGSSVGSTTITGSTSGATATCTIDATGTATLSGVTGTFAPQYKSDGTLNGAGPWDAQIAGSGVATGTYLYQQLTGSLGAAGTYLCRGNPQYGINMRSDKAQNVEVSGVVCGGQIQQAAFGVFDSTNRTCIVFNGCSGSNASTLGGAIWHLPTTAHTASWDNCDVNPTFLFAGLPASINLREGDEYNITDGNTATWGATAAGSGSNHVKVRYNGTNWTVMGK